MSFVLAFILSVSSSLGDLPTVWDAPVDDFIAWLPPEPEQPLVYHAPRVRMDRGKLREYVDVATGAWISERARGRVTPLSYCRRFYPNTVSVRPFAPDPTALECVQEHTPRIMYWFGKVNQHVEPDGSWHTDADGVSGANLDMLEYCRRFYPSTRRVVPYSRETIDTWRERGNVGAHGAEHVSYWCAP
jgi:hypothetical protein